MKSWSIQNPICYYGNNQCITTNGESNQCYEFAWLLPSSNRYLEQLAQCWDAGSSRISMCGDNLSSIVCVWFCVWKKSQTSLGQIVLFAHSGNIGNEPCDYKLLEWFQINPWWLPQMNRQWCNESFSVIWSNHLMNQWWSLFSYPVMLAISDQPSVQTSPFSSSEVGSKSESMVHYTKGPF